MEMFARNKKGGILTLIVVLVFTAMFLITLYIVGPFVGGAQLSIDILDEQPARFSIHQNTFMSTNRTRRELISLPSNFEENESIKKTLDEVINKSDYERHGGRFYLHMGLTHAGNFIINTTSIETDIAGYEYWIFDHGVIGPSRPLLRPEDPNMVSQATLIYLSPDETLREEISSLRF